MKLVRLSSGEEVIGEVTENENGIEIKGGYSLIPTGEGKLGFMPFMAYTKATEGISISNRFVLFVVDPIDELVKQINGLNGIEDTGLIVPDQKIIT